MDGTEDFELTPLQRANARRAIDEHLPAISALFERSRIKRDRPDAIPLWPENARNDAHLAWWDDTLEPLYKAMGIAELDLTSPKVVGRSFRNKVGEFLSAVPAVEDLVAFMDEFDGDVCGAVACIADGLLRMVAALILEVTALTDRELERIAVVAEPALEQLEQGESDLTRVKESESEDRPPDYTAVLARLVGKRPSWKGEHIRELPLAFGRDPNELRRLGARQLRLLAAPEQIEDSFASTWVGMACRLGAETFPLLAHRSANLTMRLIDVALERQRAETVSALRDFETSQPSRIVAAGAKSADQAAAVRAGAVDRAIEAYRSLAEGILRPFGALIVRLDVGARGLTTAVPQRPLLGELEDALTSSGIELARLLLAGISRPIRNAAAHEDIVYAASGTHAIVLEDGTLEEIDLDELRVNYAVLNSTLAGIDVAVGIACRTRLRDDESPQVAMHTWSLEFLEGVLSCAAAEYCDGYITDIGIHNQAISFTLHGKTRQERVLAMIFRTESVLPDAISQITVRNPRGRTVLDIPRPPFSRLARLYEAADEGGN